MNRRTLLTTAVAGTALAGGVALHALAAGGPGNDRAATGPTASPVTGTVAIPSPAMAPTADANVRWEPGPWGEVVVAGHRLLLPASETDGPLRDRGDGWSSDYAPTDVGAAIAVLRGPWLVFAAPAALRPKVVQAVLTPAAAADPGPVNPQAGWAIPPDVLAGFAAIDLRTLGVTARLDDPTHATVHVYLQRSTQADTELLRTTHHLVHTDRQWLIDADYSDGAAEPLTADQLPASFTLTVPGDGQE